jgi:CTD kinase subunit gamma
MRRARREAGFAKPRQHKTGTFILLSGIYHGKSCFQILENWRSKRVIEPQKVDEILSSLNHRKVVVDEYADRLTSTRLPPPATSLAKPDIIKRIEEDRERHKRLRERRWVQPISHNLSASLPPQLMSFLPIGDDDDGEGQLAIDIEFENEWETTSDWNEDDDEAAAEENELCFPGKIESQMDLC